MSYKIVESKKELYIIFEDEVDVKDATDYHLTELLEKDGKKTVDFTNVLYYNDFVYGYIELCNQLGIPVKERKK